MVYDDEACTSIGTGILSRLTSSSAELGNTANCRVDYAVLRADTPGRFEASVQYDDGVSISNDDIRTSYIPSATASPLSPV